MPKAKSDANGGLETAPEHLEHEAAEVTDAEITEQTSEYRSDVVATVATVAVVGIGAAAFEAALLPGVYKMGHKTREMMAEAHEQVHDIVAEVHAEGDVAASAVKGATVN
jgi:hypothetical protein